MHQKHDTQPSIITPGDHPQMRLFVWNHGLWLAVNIKGLNNIRQADVLGFLFFQANSTIRAYTRTISHFQFTALFSRWTLLRLRTIRGLESTCSSQASVIRSNSEHSSSCCSQWYPFSNIFNSFFLDPIFSKNLDVDLELATVSFLPWNMMIGVLRLLAFQNTFSIVMIIDRAMRILRKGIINRSPKMLATSLFFFVSAVGLIMEFTTKSSSSKPICFRAHVFTFPNSLPSGNPRKGLVMMIPETFRQGQSIRRERVSNPPRL